MEGGKNRYCVLVMGAGRAGKTTLVAQFATGQYVMTDCVNQNGIDDEYRKQVQVDKEECIVHVCITDLAAGIAASDGFLLLYDMTRRETFEQLAALRESVLREKKTHLAPMVVCGAKCDLADKRAVSAAEGEELARSFGATFFETSGMNVDEPFFAGARDSANAYWPAS
jgi:small GTP-binding protein